MRVYLETSDTARHGARSGVPTVVRGLLDGLSQRCDAVPVRWSFQGRCLTPLTPEWEQNLDRPPGKKFFLPLSSLRRRACWPLWFRTLGMEYKAPVHLHPSHSGGLQGAWLILAELMQGPHVRRVAGYAREHGMRVAGIFYDAIPWLHPELVLHRTREVHGEYMSAFAGLDAVIPISEQAARDFLEFSEEKKLPRPHLHACRLPVEILGSPRETRLKEPGTDGIRILYVSTLEPRKNHAALLAAFGEACATLHGLKIELHLVGGAYEQAPQIAETVRAAMNGTPRIFWHEKTGRDELRRFYEECDFTVYASDIEGFGLPVMESLWFGRPCVCADTGVMAENARGGGCYPVNVRDRKALADAITNLAGRPELRQELAAGAVRRKLKTWNEYADDILRILRESPQGD